MRASSSLTERLWMREGWGVALHLLDPRFTGAIGLRSDPEEDKICLHFDQVI